MAGSNHSPLVGVHRLGSPVKLPTAVDVFVREIQLNLTVAILVQRAKGRHVAQTTGLAKAGHARLRARRHGLQRGKRAVVQLEDTHPARRGLVQKISPLERGFDRIHPGVLLTLSPNVLTIGYFIGLIVTLPHLKR